MATENQNTQNGGKASKAKGKVLRVRTAKNTASFHRAGFAFGPKPRDLPLADLKEAQIAAIQNEPMLFSEIVEA